MMTTVTIAGHGAVPSDLGGDVSRGGLVSFLFHGAQSRRTLQYQRASEEAAASAAAAV